jgi:hypothetical protein
MRLARVGALALLILALSAGVAAGRVASGRYVGETSEGSPVAFQAAHGAITHFTAELGYNGKCGQGGGPGLTASIPRMKIGRTGSFGTDTRLTLGTLVDDPGRVFGKAKGKVVTGTVEQFLHGKVNRCYIETFTAEKG